MSSVHSQHGTNSVLLSCLLAELKWPWMQFDFLWRRETQIARKCPPGISILVSILVNNWKISHTEFLQWACPLLQAFTIRARPALDSLEALLDRTKMRIYRACARYGLPCPITGSPSSFGPAEQEQQAQSNSWDHGIALLDSKLAWQSLLHVSWPNVQSRMIFAEHLQAIQCSLCPWSVGIAATVENNETNSSFCFLWGHYGELLSVPACR